MSINHTDAGDEFSSDTGDGGSTKSGSAKSGQDDEDDSISTFASSNVSWKAITFHDPKSKRGHVGALCTPRPSSNGNGSGRTFVPLDGVLERACRHIGR